MDRVENFPKQVGMIGGNTQGGYLETFGQPVGEFFNRYPAGKFPGLGPAHTVTDRKYKIGILHGRCAGTAEITDIVAIKAQAEKGIFIVGTNLAAIGLPGPVQVWSRGR